MNPDGPLFYVVLRAGGDAEGPLFHVVLGAGGGAEGPLFHVVLRVSCNAEVRWNWNRSYSQKSRSGAVEEPWAAAARPSFWATQGSTRLRPAFLA